MKSLIIIFSFLFLYSCNGKAGIQKLTNQQMTIVEAVVKGQAATVEAELKKGVDVNTSDADGRSLLLIATRNNDIPMATVLIKYGADVNRQDRINDSPFLYAGAAGYLELVKLYLANGARFDIFNRYRGTALIPACERGHIEVVRLLANTKGFPVDHINRLGWTGLLEAVILGDGSERYVQIVQILIRAGANTAIADNEGVTPLQHARSRGFTQIMRLLEQVRQ